MPKRQRSGGHHGGRTAPKRRRRRHLYLVLDDWSWGYSIRKVDLSLSDSCSDDEPCHQHHTAIISRKGSPEQRLPQAVFRIESLPLHPNHFAAAFGSKIIAMAPNADDGRDTHPLTPSCVAPVLDVRKRLFSFAPRPKTNLVDPIYFSVGARLYALSYGAFQLLHLEEEDEEEEEEGGGGGDLCWCELPKHPFKRRDVTSYAVHPDGPTIFVSTKRRRATAATFTFDTSEAHPKWKQHGGGKWTLPFTGRGYFDSELDAWIGLDSDPGVICASDAVSSDSDDSIDARQQCLTRKVSKEKVVSEDPAEDHVGATLVYMGRGSKYCLVQCVSINDDDELDEDKRNFYKVPELQDEELDEAQPCRHLFRLTTFSLKFDKDGHLTTGNSQRVRYYKVPEAASDFAMEDPVAFWM